MRGRAGLSRRGLAQLLAALGLGSLGCPARDSPDTELPTEQLGARFRRLRRRIRVQVGQRERRAAALGLVDRLQRELGQLERLLVEWRIDLALLPDEQRRDRGAVLRLTRGYSEQLGELAHEAGRLAFSLRCYVSASEWPRVFPEGPEGPC
ncbi:MAG: hypothetical protein R6X02_27620 [Enhygromyxa sp.]